MYIYTAHASPFELLVAQTLDNSNSVGLSPPLLAIEVLLVLLEGVNHVPPLQHLIKVAHQVLILVQILILNSYVRIHRA